MGSLLSDPMMLSLYGRALAAGAAIGLMCGVLSVLVVVKRLGFVGQGVSHSAFGGIGIAAILGAYGMAAPGGLAEFAIIVAFCIATALGMAAISDRRTVPIDTAIGLFLVGSMAAGAVMVQAAQGIAAAGGTGYVPRSWESILFGSLLTVGRADLWMSLAITGAVVGTAWWVRRPMMFWALDEESARAFGVRTALMKASLMVLLTLAVVTAMKIAGVVLATALLVLPGATALRLSARMWTVAVLSVVFGVGGVVVGLGLSLATDWQPGPSVVLAMAAGFGAAAAIGRIVSRRTV